MLDKLWWCFAKTLVHGRCLQNKHFHKKKLLCQASDTIPLSCSPQTETHHAQAHNETCSFQTRNRVSRDFAQVKISTSLTKKHVSASQTSLFCLLYHYVSSCFILKLLQGHWVCHNWALDILGIRLRSATHGSHSITPVAFQIFFGILTSQHIWVKPVHLFWVFLNIFSGKVPNQTRRSERQRMNAIRPYKLTQCSFGMFWKGCKSWEALK